MVKLRVELKVATLVEQRDGMLVVRLASPMVERLAQLLVDL